MANDYIPRPDIEAANYLGRFAEAVAQQAARWNVPVAEVEAAQGTAAAFAEALATANDPATRTAPMIERKNAARRKAELVCRRVVARLRGNPDLKDADRAELGLRRPPGGRGTRRRPPESAPALVVQPTGGCFSMHSVSFRDAATPDRRGKPPHATSLRLFRVVSDAPVTLPAEAEYVADATRSPLRLSRPDGAGGRWITYFARWSSRRGEMGPWSNPRSVRAA